MYIVLINLQTLNHLLTVVSADLIVSTLDNITGAVRADIEIDIKYSIQNIMVLSDVVLINVAHTLFILE